MNEILNPYIAGAPVVEASMFFGRDDVFSWIERSLAGKFVDHILVLHGQRRVGKTSVLKQIPNFLPDNYIQVFFDLQGRTGTTLDRFLWWLASEIVRTLKREHNVNIPKPERKEFEDTEYLINEFLPGLRPILGEKTLLLTFDEFDSLDHPEIQESLARPLIAYLRRLIEIEGLNFIFSIGSSGDKLENMQASYTDFFKSALYRKISFLTRDDCLRLVTKPVEGVIKYEKNAVDRIFEITSGHPYFTQLVCHELFSRCQRTGSRVVSAEDVEAILEDVVERGTVNLKFLWDEASDLEKWTLAALAQMDGGNIQELSKKLTDQRVRFSESDLNSATIHLRDKDVITADNRFVIHLMRLWLTANRPMDRVQEELVEVNPIANRYIEIGDEYRDRGQFQQAIESYQQALDADPGNMKAQTNIANIHLKKKSFSEAAEAFERALKIDDEDVVAKTGYCESNLALGNESYGRNERERAIAYFQKILVINAAHTDARQRLATIYREQAEAQLAADQYDEALQSFSQAIDFTPEDDQLLARYKDVAAKKKYAAVASLLNRAEKALSQQRWDEAAEMMEEAIKIDPDNQDLQIKFLETKDAPRQLKIQSYRREAEQAITRGNWEKAIAALETATLLAPENKELNDWLASIRSGQRDAQLNLYLRQAEKATKAGNWEAALAARHAALKLSPDNPDLQRALEETRQAQHQSKLDGYQKRVDEAITAENWDNATHIIQEAIKFAPQNETWKNKLIELETVRHNATLNGIRLQANAAQDAQDWGAAITALEAYQKLAPDDDTIHAEINMLRVQKRESELAGFKERAEKAATDGRWADAVQAWETYLKLGPADAAEVTDKLQHARRLAKLAGDYAEAQESIRKKRYKRAIELLQGIIAQEPTYKSTSRLLVEAVEANKSVPLWRRARVWGGLTAAIVLIVAIGFGIVWLGQQEFTFPAASSFPPTSTATQMVTPSLTSTPALDPTIQSALDFIQNEAPVYQTSFDSWEFGESIGNVSIENGKLVAISENREEISRITFSSLSSDRYAVEYEFRILEPDAAEGQCDFNSVNHDDFGTESWRIIGASFILPNLTKLAVYEYPDQWTNIAEVKTTLDFSETNTVTLIVLGDQITAFLNGQLIYSVQNPVGSAIYTKQGFSAAFLVGCEIDNYKFWDLSGPPTLSPKIQAGLNFIETQPPDYQTSFDSWDFGELPSYASVDTGKLVLTSTGEHVGVGLDIFDSDHLAFEFEFAIVDSEQDGHCVFYPEGYGDQETPRGVTSGFHNSGGTNFALTVREIQNDYAYSSFDASKPNKYTLMILGDELVGFINGQLVYAERDPNGKALYTASSFAASHGITCEYDNFKAWDLRKGITVTSAEDSGPGTMRQALLDAQVGDVIKFDADVFPPDQPATIYLTSELPRISQGNITIDASNAGVILDGTNLQEGEFGLIISSDGNTIMGLQIINVVGMALYVEGGGYNVIGGNRTIGAGPIGQGNLIASNGVGIDLVFAGAGGNIIKGNIIGADVSGNGFIGNADAGINFEGLSPGGIPYGFTHNIVGPDNIIIKNGAGGGIRIQSVRVPVIITANAIYDNEGPGINHNISAAEPDESVILYFEIASGIVNGSTCSDCVVEIFSTDTKDGKVYEGTVTADAFGNFSFNKGEALSGPFLTATTTPPGGSTSQFSQPTSTLSTIQIALDVIQSKAPLYQTSFDVGDNDLGFLELGRDALVENGKLMVTSSGSHVSAGLDIPDSDRFAVEFELLISDASPQGHCPFYTENDEVGSSYRGTATVFEISGETIFDLNMPEGIDQVHLATSRFDVLKTNRITLIILGDQAAAFIDGKLAYTAFNPDMMTSYKTIYFAATSTITCEYDNYKFWDLSGVNLNP